MKEPPQFTYDDISYDDVPYDRRKWFFTGAMISATSPLLDHLDSNYDFERLLRKHKVLRKNNKTDTEMCQFWVYFSSKKAGENFIDRLNKFLQKAWEFKQDNFLTP